MTDQSLIHYRVELPVGTPEQWAIHGPNWTDLWLRPDKTDQTVLDEIWIEDCYRVRGLDLLTTEEDIAAGTSGKLVIDIGANIGLFSALCLAFGASGVVAVEPEPANVALLRDNLERWWDSRYVHLWPFAVSGRVERVGIIGEAGTAHTAPVFDDDTPTDDHVETVMLEQIIETVHSVHPDKRIALLKCDVEGAEYETFLACPHDSLALVERIVMETHGPEMCPWLDAAPVGQLVEHLLQTHGVEVFGYPNRGGMLIAHRY